MSDESMNGDDMSDAEAEAIERRNGLISEFGQEVCDAAREVFGKADWQSALEAGAYLGWYGELAAYAEEYLEDNGAMKGWTALAKDYFDYAAYGRDLERNGVIGEHNGHIFNTNLYMTAKERDEFNWEFAGRWSIYDGVLWRWYETYRDGQDVWCASPCGDVTTMDDALKLMAETLHNKGE